MAITLYRRGEENGYELSFNRAHLSLMESKINLSRLTVLINKNFKRFFDPSFYEHYMRLDREKKKIKYLKTGKRRNV